MSFKAYASHAISSCMNMRSGYALTMLLVAMAVSVVLAMAVSHIVMWGISSARAAQARARGELVHAFAWHQLITDCLTASMHRTAWVWDGSHWVFKTPEQWVSWFVRDGVLYRRYGVFNINYLRWHAYKTERVSGMVRDLSMGPRFEQQHLTEVALQLTLQGDADGYTYHTTLV